MALAGLALQPIFAAPIATPITADLSVTTPGNELGPVDIVYTVTLSEPNTSGSAITFDLDDQFTGTATSGGDYTAIPNGAQISVAPGTTTGSFTVEVINDPFAESVETIDVQMSSPSDANVTLGTARASADIADNDGEATLDVDILAASLSELDGTAATSVTITRNTDTTHALEVNLSSSDSTEAAIQTMATIPAGQSSVTVALDAVDDLFIDGDQTVTITASALDSGGAVELDPSFGTAGLAMTQLEMSIQPPELALALQADGKIVSASEGSNSNELKLTRLNPDGSFDATFGANGLVVDRFGLDQPVPHRILIQDDGKDPRRRQFLGCRNSNADAGSIQR